MAGSRLELCKPKPEKMISRVNIPKRGMLFLGCLEIHQGEI